MFKKVRLFHALKKNGGPFILLPDGLYTLRNKYIQGSFFLKRILKYNIGDVLELKKRPDLRDWGNNFSAVVLYRPRPFKSVSVRELELPRILGEIKRMNYKVEKSPYENFLEVVLIKVLMQSLTNSKTLLGGIWSTGGLLSGSLKYGKSTFGYFAENIEEKNRTIIDLKQKLNDYPENFVKLLSEYRSVAFNRSHSSYSTFLEYRILQVRYKIVLQELCLHSSYLTGEEKKKYDADLTAIKGLLHTYPVK